MAKKVIKAEVIAEIPVINLSDFNCPDCKGSGLKDEHTLCPTCLGKGKI
jgi:DnaJ-class molecular chaperone